MMAFMNKLNIARAMARCEFNCDPFLNWRKCVNLLAQKGIRLFLRAVFNRRLVFCFTLILGLAGCASNEKLFAQYDALCHQGICVAARPTEVFYTPEKLNLIWEPAVYFGYDLDFMQESEIARLDRNLEFLNRYKDLKISLQGFTDSNASSKYNLALSLRRVETVRDYLMQNGVGIERIQASRGGEMLPIQPGDSIEEKIINRRVEMMLLDSSGRPLSVGLDPSVSDSDDFVPPTPDRKEK